MSNIHIFLNGHNKEVSATTVNQLITDLKINPQFLAIAVNNQVITAKDYPLTNIKHGDHIEIIKPIAGG